MANPEKPIRVVGRYSIFEPFAAGGMATVHLGHMAGSAGFSRVVAIKRMKPELVHDTNFATMFQDEASLAARVNHPNVVTTLDVIRDEGELMIVMEYVRGLGLREIMESAFDGRLSIPLDVALGIMGGVLEGLHAAHGARGDDGQLLGLVHRDISPHNILVGRDGIAKILDFGVAKAVSKLHVTATHEVRGKLSYLSPERILQKPVDLRCDVFSSGVVLWEMLANRKRYEGENVGQIVDAIMTTDPPSLSTERPEVPASLDRVVRIATARSPHDRYPSAEAMLTDLERVGTFATKRAIASWLSEIAGDLLSESEDKTRAIRAQQARVSSASAPVEDTFVGAADLDDEPKTTRLDLSTTSASGQHPLPELARQLPPVPQPTPSAPQQAAPQQGAPPQVAPLPALSQAAPLQAAPQRPVPQPSPSGSYGTLSDATEILKTTKINRADYVFVPEERTVRMRDGQNAYPAQFPTVVTRRLGKEPTDPMTKVGLVFVFIAVALAVLALMLLVLRGC